MCFLLVSFLPGSPGPKARGYQPLSNSVQQWTDLMSVPDTRLLCGLGLRGLLFGLRFDRAFFFEGLTVDDDLVDFDLDEALAVSLHLLVLLLALQLEHEEIGRASCRERG